MDESHCDQFVKDFKAKKMSVTRAYNKFDYVKTTFNIIFSHVLGLKVESFFNDLWPNFLSFPHSVIGDTHPEHLTIMQNKIQIYVEEKYEHVLIW
jgi:hypothetical protein